MTPRERKTFFLASLILFLASGARYAYETRDETPLLPPDSAGVGAVLLEGTREARAEEERRSRPLAEGERIDPNRAPPAELDRLPGVGPALADRIVTEREEGGAFRSAAELDRVRGIGNATVRRLEPHLDFSAPPPVTFDHTPRLPGARRSSAEDSGASAAPMIDLNRATSDELQSLRGVGPVLAERILVSRREKGRFRAVDDLLEVRGVGPATLERLRPRIRVTP